MPEKLWAGRFERGLDPLLDSFQSSLWLDQELVTYDIQGSVAHARGLAAAGIISARQLKAIEKGLRTVHATIRRGPPFAYRESDEDIHSAVERLLSELDPDAGARLHAGRSRNDQVATDVRLYCRGAARAIALLLAEAVAELAVQARTHADWVVPGYTHLQRGQPVTVGHHLLAHAEPLLRDGLRVRHAYEAADELPLGSGALAGSTLPLAREVAARELGFSRISENSMDAVGDRDFALDLLHACVSIGIHLSRLGEDLVLWASSEFGFLKLADEIATGSSLMPQKKNPDIAELLRGRSGRALGAFVQLATVLKGLPLTYDKDLQEDKVALFAGVRNAVECLEAAMTMVPYLEFDRDRMAAAAADPGVLATDSAEQMVAAGTPFREAHHAVARAVAEGSHEPPWDAAESLRRRDLQGGPNPARVRRRAAAVGREAAKLARWAESRPNGLEL